MTKRRSKGDGSIYFNDRLDRWVAQITLPNGQRKGKSSKIQKEVRDWLIDQRNKLRDGLFVTDDQIKLGDFLDRYTVIWKTCLNTPYGQEHIKETMTS